MGSDAESPSARSPLPEDSHNGWDVIYAAKGACGVSWYQSVPSHSLGWIDALVPDCTSSLIDVGAGASTLVDGLLMRGYRMITLLDQSEIALALTRSRLQADPVLGHYPSSIRWLHADLLDEVLPQHAFDLWHDRAVFHFFRSKVQRLRYRQQLLHALPPGGHLIMATFAVDGPSHCSGQSVARYTHEDLAHALGSGFELVDHRKHRHLTPSGHAQSFLYAVFQRQSNGST